MKTPEQDAVQVEYIADLTTEYHAHNARLGELMAQLTALEQREEDLKTELAKVREAMKPLTQDINDCGTDMQACITKRHRAVNALAGHGEYFYDSPNAGIAAGCSEGHSKSLASLRGVNRE